MTRRLVPALAAVLAVAVAGCASEPKGRSSRRTTSRRGCRTRCPSSGPHRRRTTTPTADLSRCATHDQDPARPRPGRPARARAACVQLVTPGPPGTHDPATTASRAATTRRPGRSRVRAVRHQQGITSNDANPYALTVGRHAGGGRARRRETRLAAGRNLGRVVAVRRHGAQESRHARSRRGCHGGSVAAVSPHAVGNGWGPRVVVTAVERGCCNTSSPFPARRPTPQAARVLPRASLRDHGRGPRRGAPRAARGPAELPGTGLRRGPSGLVTSAHPAGPPRRRCADRAATRPGPLPALRGDPGAAAGVVCAPARLRRRGRRRGPAGCG